MSVLTDPICAVVTVPPDVTMPDAVVYFVIGDRLVLADLTTPIGDAS